MPRQKIRPATIDLDTGEITNGIFIYCPKKQHSSFSRGGFVVMSALESDPIPLSDRMKQSGIESVIDGGKKSKQIL
jgi:hypothetical protein